ncbi:MAG TPA: ACT domain-containing protein [Dongiaceae bacterium]|nr:ACT domain-containing protein [Dongiaceae bacterium]
MGQKQAGVATATSMQLKFRPLKSPYGIVRLAPDASVPDWATRGEFTSISRTADELSIVCPVENLPSDVASPHHWICLKLEGPFPFSQTGVLLSFIQPLSSNMIPIFTISTYDTDYVLIPEEFVAAALSELQNAGHEPVEPR